jgi:hypothetical protein
LVNTTKTLIRTDWGGQPPQEIISNKAREQGLELNPQLLELIQSIAEDQVAGCRKRVSYRMNEIYRRLENTNQDVSLGKVKTSWKRSVSVR